MLSSLGHCFHKVWLVAGIIQMGEIDSLAEVNVTEQVSSLGKIAIRYPMKSWGSSCKHKQWISGHFFS